MLVLANPRQVSARAGIARAHGFESHARSRVAIAALPGLLATRPRLGPDPATCATGHRLGRRVPGGRALRRCSVWRDGLHVSSPPIFRVEQIEKTPAVWRACAPSRRASWLALLPRFRPRSWLAAHRWRPRATERGSQRSLPEPKLAYLEVILPVAEGEHVPGSSAASSTTSGAPRHRPVGATAPPAYCG